MQHLRPECKQADPGTPCPTNGTAYLLVYNAVKAESGLIRGRLHDKGMHCAIGSTFTAQPNIALPTNFIDEVAMVNDSAPTVSPRQRRLIVLRWLRWKLNQLGMPGFASAPASKR